MRVNRIVCVMVAIVAMVLPSYALNWDEISTSGDYYFGVGHGKNEAEASEQAKAQIAGSIVSHVSNTFTLESDEKRQLGETEYRARLQMRVYRHTPVACFATLKLSTGPTQSRKRSATGLATAKVPRCSSRLQVATST